MANICVRNHRNRFRKNGRSGAYRQVARRQRSGSHQDRQKTQRCRIARLDNPTKETAKEVKATSTTTVRPVFSKADRNFPQIRRARAQEKAAASQAAIWLGQPLQSRHKKPAV